MLMAYNLLDYPDAANTEADTALRNPSFRTIIGAVQPDLLVVTELNSLSGMNGFLTHVMNASTTSYSAAPFIDGPDSDNGLYYRSSKFIFISHKKIKTDLRNISEFKLLHINSGDTIRVYALHLKASSGTANELQRAMEVDSLRKETNALPAGTDFIVCGDFNFYSESESGYQKLLQITGGNEGHCVDPISLSGSWNNIAYAIHHTQSTRIRAFGGGSTGGMDDRFDLVLYSKAISQSGGVTFVPNSQIAFGNDGNHYNDSINRMPNNAVAQYVADALHNASDHIPVLSQFSIQYGASAPPDAGVVSLVTPGAAICSATNQTLQVQVKNFAADSLNFAVHNLQVVLQVTDPVSGIHNFSATISSGSLQGNTVMVITFDSTLTMLNAGNYVFNAYTVLNGDGNADNNAMAATSVMVYSTPTVSITPQSPVSLCSGSSVTLTAGNSQSYLWSTGATTQSILVSTAGEYAVTITATTGCSATSAPVTVNMVSQGGGTVFAETMGSVPATTAISLHEANNGFDNDLFTMTGSADVRNTQSSLGLYANASGGANVFITNSPGRDFMISGINTSNYINPALSFAIFKSTIASTASDLSVQVSSDGINYYSLSFPPLPSGSGTANWYYRTATGTIPAVSNLRIRFLQNGNITQYRIDDILLSHAGEVPAITASGPLTVCTGEHVVLSIGAVAGAGYQWKKDGVVIQGATSLQFEASATGAYSCDAINACGTYSSNVISVVVNNCQAILQLKLFIEGYYAADGLMKPVLLNQGVDQDPFSDAVDTIMVELHDAQSPEMIITSVKSILHTNGTVYCTLSSSVIGVSAYIAIHQRNALETWSSVPLLMTDSNVYDFTTGITQAFPDNVNPNPQMIFLPDAGLWAFYSGDVNQDGQIAGDDFNLVEVNVTDQAFGYFSTDLTGEGASDGSDFNLLEVNASYGLFAAHP